MKCLIILAVISILPIDLIVGVSDAEEFEYPKDSPAQSENGTEKKFDARKDTVFKLYTRQNADKPAILKIDDPSTVTQSHFDPKNPTRFVIHGWLGDVARNLIDVLKSSYFKVGDFNVIKVDWSKGAQTEYIAATHHVPRVGLVCAQFIEFLAASAGVQLADVAVVGFSLGAHVAGITGKKMTTGKLSAIVGLDPAGPQFSMSNVEGRIAPTDAEYVEVIHTNTATYGCKPPIGQTDFYPNGGKSQPGCMRPSCSHSRSYQLYAESIESNRFSAVPCKSHSEAEQEKCGGNASTVKMGGEPPNQGKPRGVYHLKTNAKVPYGQG